MCSVQFSCSVVSDCDPVNRSTPGLPVHHQLPEFTQTHVHRVGVAIQPSHPLSSPSPAAPNPSQHQSLFQWVNSSHEVAKVLEFSALASVLPKNIHWSLDCACTDHMGDHALITMFIMYSSRGWSYTDLEIRNGSMESWCYQRNSSCLYRAKADTNGPQTHWHWIFQAIH